MAAPDHLALSDADLRRQCRLETGRVRGPGGQHRNRRDTAVRLLHEPTGVTAQAAEERSQRRNREVALMRLRQAIALQVRRPVPLETYTPPAELLAILPGARGRLGPNHRDYWRGVQALLDLLVAVNGSVSETAARAGVSTGALSRLLLADPRLNRAVNAWRAGRGLRPLR